MDGSGRPGAPQQPDGPLQGVKYGAVVSVDGILRFESTTRRAQHSRCYDVDSKAICQLGMDHVVPAWSCTCGFYAMADEEALAAAWGEARLSHWAVLRVEVSGRVIEHERGWRAARQVVVEAAWEDRCHRCGHHAAGFGFDGERPGPLVPLCRTCAGRGLWSASEVAGRLGTDVRLVPAGDRTRWSAIDVETVRRRWRRDMARRLVTLAACGLGVAAVVSAASHGSAEKQRTLAQELAPLIDVRNAALTSRSLTHELPAGRQVEVVAESDAHEASVEAVAVLEPAPPGSPPEARRCRILLVRARTDPDQWTIDEPGTLTDPPVNDLSACADRALRLTTPQALHESAAGAPPGPPGGTVDAAAPAAGPSTGPAAAPAAGPSTGPAAAAEPATPRDPVPPTGRTSDG